MSQEDVKCLKHIRIMLAMKLRFLVRYVTILLNKYDYDTIIYICLIERRYESLVHRDSYDYIEELT